MNLNFTSVKKKFLILLTASIKYKIGFLQDLLLTLHESYHRSSIIRELFEPKQIKKEEEVGTSEVPLPLLVKRG